MDLKRSRSVFYKYSIFVCLLLPVLALGESASNAELQTSNDDEISFGRQKVKNVNIKHAKYVGSLLFDKFNPPLVGTVTILNNQWVLASAYGLSAFASYELQVRLGSTHYNKGGTLYGVSQIIVHPSYSYLNIYDYNVALLKLDKQIQFSKEAGKIDISPDTIRHNGLDAKHYSFGRNNQYIVGRLQEETIRLINYKKCRTLSNDVTNLSNLSFCSTNPRGAPCSIDFGSPVVRNKELIGLFTFPLSCGSAKISSVYADVTRYKKWIDDTIEANTVLNQLT